MRCGRTRAGTAAQPHAHVCTNRRYVALKSAARTGAVTVFGQHRCAYCCIVAQVLLLVGGDGTTWYVEPPTALLACVTEDQARGLRQPRRSLQDALLMHDDIIMTT